MNPLTLTKTTATKKTAARPSDSWVSMTVKKQKLLAHAVSFYQHIFADDHIGIDYLKARGINDNQSFLDFDTGFSNGILLYILPEDDQILASLKRIGIRNAKAKDAFSRRCWAMSL